MFSFFGYTTKREVLVCNADTLPGFHTALSLQETQKFEKVICAVSDREDEYAKQLEKKGLEVRDWDLNDRKSIENTLRGIDHVLLIPNTNEKMVEQTRNILEACRSEVKHMVYWSMLGLDKAEGEQYKVFKMAREIEEMVKKSGIDDLAICRIGFVMQALFALSNIIQDRGILPLPLGRGKFAPVNLKDCAHAAATLLGHAGTEAKNRHQMFTFTGPELVTGRKLVELANRVLQSEIEFQDINEEDFRKIMKELGEFNDVEIEFAVEGSRLIRENKLCMRSNDLQKLLEDRKVTDIETFFKKNADAFRPGGGRIRRLVFRELL